MKKTASRERNWSSLSRKKTNKTQKKAGKVKLIQCEESVGTEHLLELIRHLNLFNLNFFSFFLLKKKKDFGQDMRKLELIRYLN